MPTAIGMHLQWSLRWNEIICAFRSEMPRGRHRRQMRHYDNSFTASEAVDWLHDYLLKNHNFGSKISRTQAIQLLQKFQKSRMFEDVKRLKHEHEVFQDNNRLYKFIYNSPRKSQSGTIKSPLKVVRPPLVPMIDNKFEVNEKVTRMSLKNKERLVQKKSIEASQKHNDENVRFSGSVQVDGNIGNPVVKRPITVYDVHEMWKDSIVERLQLLLKLPSLEEILDGERVVDPRTIIHNIYRISASGVVMLIDKTEDLPHWVTSAMKCLVNWPNASGSGSCLPKYVGFETDVFRVITDYFTSFSQPLVTYDLYYLFVTIFVRGEFLDGDHSQTSGMPTLEQAQQQNLRSMASVTSIENLMNSLAFRDEQWQSTPVLKETDERKPDHDVLQLAPVEIKYTEHNLPRDSCYETAFEFASPVTRIIPCRRASLRQSTVSTDEYVDMTENQSRLTRGLCNATDRISRNFVISDDWYLDMTPSKTRDQTCYRTNQPFPSNQSIRPVGNSRMVRSISTDDVYTPLLSRQRFNYARRSERRPRSPVENNRGYLTVRQIKRGNEQKRASQRRAKCRISSNSSVEATNDSNDVIKQDSGGYLNLGFRNASREDVRDSYQSQSSSSLYYTASSTHSSSTNVSDTSLKVKPGSLKSYATGNDLSSENLTSEATYVNVTPNDRQSDEISFASQTWSSSTDTRKTLLHRAVSWPNIRMHYLSTNNLHKTNDDGKLTIEAMQLACLMLPPVNRRHLHILLRVINKISRNEQLVLNPNSSNRDMALQELSKTIINSEKEIDYDEIMMKRLIVFLLDNCEKIFSSDSDLKLEVERNIAGLRRTQGRYTVPFDDLGTYTYCDRISIEEFEVQQKTVDPKIMSGLLEDIVTNHKLTHKEKRKKLLQFKELYPDVYMQRFPTVDSEVDVMKAKIKPSKSQLFTRLKSKRI